MTQDILTAGCCENGREETALQKARYFLIWATMTLQNDWALCIWLSCSARTDRRCTNVRHRRRRAPWWRQPTGSTRRQTRASAQSASSWLAAAAYRNSRMVVKACGQNRRLSWTSVREIIAVCSEIHTKHINTLCGQNIELLNVKAVYKINKIETFIYLAITKI